MTRSFCGEVFDSLAAFQSHTASHFHPSPRISFQSYGVGSAYMAARLLEWWQRRRASREGQACADPGGLGDQGQERQGQRGG
eukprot:5707345-Alexandrium_andersonii.AAC.1